MTLTDELAAALAALERARVAVADEKIVHREAVVREIVNAELSVRRVLHLISGEVP